jgi:hypothetical protein
MNKTVAFAKREFILSCILLLSISSIAQTGGKKYFFKEIGWTVVVPPEFNVVREAADVDISNEKGGPGDNKDQANLHITKRLITAMREQDFFIASLSVDNKTTINGVQKEFDKSYMDYAKRENTTVDTATSIEQIAGHDFTKQQLTVRKNGKISFRRVTMYTFCDKYCLGIAYQYSSKESKDQIETMLKTSVFGK